MTSVVSLNALPALSLNLSLSMATRLAIHGWSSSTEFERDKVQKDELETFAGTAPRRKHPARL